MSFILLILSSFSILLSLNYSNQFPNLWADPLIVAGGCTQATYANCINALKYDKTGNSYQANAPTCTDKDIKWSEVGWTDFANAQKDIATIRANPAIAIFIDCVCKSVCREFQDFKDAAITQSGACAVAAASVPVADYSQICMDSSKYTPTALFKNTGKTCDEVMELAAASDLKGIDFSSVTTPFTCGGVSLTQRGIINSYADRCGCNINNTCRINSNGEYQGEKWSWVTASGKNICAGINTNCADMTLYNAQFQRGANKLSSCTTLGVGPCEGTATAPVSYMKMAFSRIKTFANGEEKDLVFDGLGYRDNKADVPSGDTG